MVCVTLGVKLGIIVVEEVGEGDSDGVELGVVEPNVAIDDGVGVFEGVTVAVNVPVLVCVDVAVWVRVGVEEAFVTVGVHVPVVDGLGVPFSVAVKVGGKVSLG